MGTSRPGHGTMITATTTIRPDPSDDGFRHEALLYAGADEFVTGTAAFIRDGLTGGEPTLVVVSATKIALLRDELGCDARHVQFADMADVGRNPARIIPAWRAFVDERPVGDGRLRGVGEPIWSGRSAAELVECQRHESLLNVAFEGREAWSLLCPYDVDTLDDSVIDEARASHPYVREAGRTRTSPHYRGTEASAAPFAEPLPEPPVTALQVPFGVRTLKATREVVARFATDAGCGARRAADLVVAVNEITTNSLLHAGGDGMLRLWQDGDTLIAEVQDRGRLDDPLVGRARPAPEQENGRGLWVANQLCELVQVRAVATGTVVRLHARRR